MKPVAYVVAASVLAVGIALWRRAPPKARTVHCVKCGPTEVSVVSLNVLAGCLVSPRKYSWVPARILAWEHRWDQIKALLAHKINGDIICLQEVETELIEVYKEYLDSLGYACVVQDRSESKFAIANATFYRRSKLRLTWSEDRSRVLLACFELLAHPASKPIYVANCHLEGHPYKPAERFNQIRSALNRVRNRQQSVNEDPADAHVLVVGDLNSTRQDGVYRFLYRGRLEGGWREFYLPEKVLTVDTVTHPYVLRDVYASYAAFRTPFTRAVPGNACVIDFIFASDTADVTAVLQYWVPRRSLMAGRVALPNAKHPSDHIPLGVVLRLVDAPVGDESLDTS